LLKDAERRVAGFEPSCAFRVSKLHAYGGKGTRLCLLPVACCSKPKLAFKIITAKTGFYDFNLPINTMRQLSMLFASFFEANNGVKVT
jgi:hypothetical protein